MTNDPDAMERLDWQANVKKGIQCVKAISRSSWTLGDLALKLFPPKGDDNPAPMPTEYAGTVRTLTDFADAIDISPKTLARMRLVSHAWPPAHRRPNVAWATHRELMHNPDRFTLIHDGMSRRDAAKLVGHVTESNTAPIAPTVPADRAVAEARAALAIAGDKRRKFDPETREALIARAEELEQIAAQIRLALSPPPVPVRTRKPRKRRILPIGAAA